MTQSIGIRDATVAADETSMATFSGDDTVAEVQPGEG